MEELLIGLMIPANEILLSNIVLLLHPFINSSRDSAEVTPEKSVGLGVGLLVMTLQTIAVLGKMSVNWPGDNSVSSSGSSESDSDSGGGLSPKQKGDGSEVDSQVFHIGPLNREGPLNKGGGGASLQGRK